MAKKIMVDVSKVSDALRQYKSDMEGVGLSKEMVIGIDGCITLCEWECSRQLELRKREHQGMLNSMCKTYERIQETTDPVNFVDFEAMILDHLVASNNFLATQIEELENCSPEEFKKMALVLAKKEL